MSDLLIISQTQFLLSANSKILLFKEQFSRISSNFFENFFSKLIFFFDDLLEEVEFSEIEELKE